MYRYTAFCNNYIIILLTEYLIQLYVCSQSIEMTGSQFYGRS